jgi:NCAIR mutase (PurE)-related protein
MDSHELLRMLEAVRGGSIAPADAVQRLRTAPLEETGGFATIDLHRRLRCGSPEVVFGQGKTPEQIIRILDTLDRAGQGAMVTRVPPEVGATLAAAHRSGRYHPLGRIFKIEPRVDPGPKLGRVVVITAGTSDLPVAEEAKLTAEAWNCTVDLIADVGVAGIHRLFNRLGDIAGADVVVCVAGMEAALPSVLGGLVDCPVIAVPTSVGYGAHFGGLASLLGMLNSCSSNVTVVNIDSGFNGGHVAGLIARRMGQARASTTEGSTPGGPTPAAVEPASPASGA